MASRGEYTPKSGALAGQTFSSYYQYQNARSRELGFSGYTEERNFRRDQAVEENIRKIYPGYPADRLAFVMFNNNGRIKNLLRNATLEDLYADDGWLGKISHVFYH